MRESRTYGFVRGAHSNMRPYRDPYIGKEGEARWKQPEENASSCFIPLGMAGIHRHCYNSVSTVSEAGDGRDSPLKYTL
jgi:hypothetical protein